MVSTRITDKDIPSFIADCHLGKLAKQLRLMGFDTLYFTQIEDDDLITLAQEEKRIILTRDRLLSERKEAPALLLKAIHTREQLQALITHYDITENPAPFNRCIVCNTPLQDIDKAKISDRLPDKIKKHFDYFQLCSSCDRIYWHGDHYKHMKVFLEGLFKKDI